jgi:hypothetical protein
VRKDMQGGHLIPHFASEAAEKDVLSSNYIRKAVNRTSSILKKV